MDGDRWLVSWALAGVVLGGASLLVPLSIVELGGGPVALGVLAARAALFGAPGALVVAGGGVVLLVRRVGRSDRRTRPAATTP